MRLVVSFPTSIRTSKTHTVGKSYAHFTKSVSETESYSDSKLTRVQIETAIYFKPMGQTYWNFLWKLVVICRRSTPIFTSFGESLTPFLIFGKVYALLFLSFFSSIFLLLIPKPTLPFSFSFSFPFFRSLSKTKINLIRVWLPRQRKGGGSKCFRLSQ